MTGVITRANRKQRVMYVMFSAICRGVSTWRSAAKRATSRVFIVRLKVREQSELSQQVEKIESPALINLLGFAIQPTSKVISGLHSGYASDLTQSQLRDGFNPICIQGLPWRCLWGISNFKNEAKGSSKMADGSANENCSFNCKWQPPMDAAISKNPFNNQNCCFNCTWWLPYGGCHFWGSTAFRVGRRIEFLKAALVWLTTSSCSNSTRHT